MATQIYATFRSAHDPDTGQRWQVPVTLPTGRSIQAVTVTVVDATDSPLDQSLLPTPQQLAISAVQWTQSDTVTNTWQVSFYAFGGVPGTKYLVRFRFTLDGDSVPFADRTFALRCAHT